MLRIWLVPAALLMPFAAGGRAAPLPEAVREVVDQPFIAPAPNVRLNAPRTAGVLTAPGVRITQVNVAAGGLNVAGDAANEPSICIDPLRPNRLAVGWRQFNSIASNFREAGVASSRDGGRTWTPIRRLQPGLFRSDPVLRANADGRFFYNSLRVFNGQYLCHLFMSDDGGDTWGEPLFAVGGDKTWMTIDTTSGMGRGNIYQSWNLAGNQYSPATFSRSLDGGFNWDPPIETPFSPIFGTLAVGNSGEVYVIGTDFSSNILIRSDDAQNALLQPNFTSALVDLTGLVVFQPTVNPAGLAGQLQVDVDHSEGPSRGYVYVSASVNPAGPDPLDVTIARSTDGGATFAPPIRLNTDPPAASNYQWFGTMAVAPNGRIDVIWNDTRHDATSATSRLYYRYSTDAGDSWSPEIALTEPFNTMIGWPQQNKLGDYYDMASDNLGASIAMAATWNGEQDVYFIRIGPDDCNRNDLADDLDISEHRTRDCNANGIPDECDLAAGVLPDADANGVPDSCQTPACYADSNRDGIVNFADLTSVLSNWGSVGPAGSIGDADADGGVEFSDITTILVQWLATCP